MKKTIAVIGLGKLGASIALSIASRGYQVVGVDVVKKRVDAINSGTAHLDEPGYAQLLKKYKQNITATVDTRKAIEKSDITFIVVPTPSHKNGLFANSYVLQAVKNIGQALQKKTSFHVVAVVSTVMPGSSIKYILPALEKISHKRCGIDFGYCYNPTFVALGNVIQNYLSPDLVLIGESDIKSGDILEKFYQNLVINRPQIKRMNLINAEITKLALNTYITTKISYANMLTQLCDALPGADVAVVTGALGHDLRIGHKYLSGGLPYGGPCFPRDNKALTAVGKKHRIRLPLAQATDRINRSHLHFVIKKIEHYLIPSATVGIIGLTYKENTSVLDEASGLKIAQALIKKNYSIKAYNLPLIKLVGRIHIDKKIELCQTVEELVQQADLIIVTTRTKEYVSQITRGLIKKVNNTIIIDSWRILPIEKLPKSATVIYLGKSS